MNRTTFLKTLSASFCLPFISYGGYSGIKPNVSNKWKRLGLGFDNKLFEIKSSNLVVNPRFANEVSSDYYYVAGLEIPYRFDSKRNGWATTMVIWALHKSGDKKLDEPVAYHISHNTDMLYEFNSILATIEHFKVESVLQEYNSDAFYLFMKNKGKEHLMCKFFDQPGIKSKSDVFKAHRENMLISFNKANKSGVPAEFITESMNGGVLDTATFLCLMARDINKII